MIKISFGYLLLHYIYYIIILNKCILSYEVQCKYKLWFLMYNSSSSISSMYIFLLTKKSQFKPTYMYIDHFLELISKIWAVYPTVSWASAVKARAERISHITEESGQPGIVQADKSITLKELPLTKPDRAGSGRTIFD